MLRLLSAFTLVTVLASTLLLTQPAPVAAESVDCPRVVFGPILDSRLDDWPALPQFVASAPADWRPAGVRYAERAGPEDVSADVRLAWDSQALYVAIEVRDDVLARVESAADIDRGDSIVLALAGEGSDVANQFVIALLKATSLVWRAVPAEEAGEVRTIGRALAARPEQDGSTRLVYELSIPWSELKQIRPLPGARFTLTVSICDDDGEGLEGCLEKACAVTLSAKGMPPLAGSEPSPPPGLKPTFPAPNVARFDGKCLVLNGKDTVLLGGEIDYAHLPEEAWTTRVRLLKEAGLNTVGVTVPWAYHQPTQTAPDLSSLVRFLRLCAQSGLLVQLNIGPFAGHPWEAGAVPGWVVGLAPGDRTAAVSDWLDAVLPVLVEQQLSRGGPVASVLVRPIPNDRGQRDPGALAEMLYRLRAADIAAPVLTANAVAARGSRLQSLVNILDTLSFYTPISAAELIPKLATLGQEEFGPVAITALAGDYSSSSTARRSADVVRAALGQGATAVVLGDFAPGLDSALPRSPGIRLAAGIVDPAGGLSAGYGESRLLGQFLQCFGPDLARSVSAAGLLETDAPDVKADLRFARDRAFIFLRNEHPREARQVRLQYLDPETDQRVSIPQSGAIYLPPASAKILPLGLSVGRGILRYATSEVAAVHAVGERTLLVLYGDPDTPGEIALKLPGPPLVSGPVARQSWDATTKTLTLDYYHGTEDRYLLVDEIEVAVLCRDRAAWATNLGGAGAAITLSGGLPVTEASLSADALTASLACAAGTTEITAALARRPVSVTLDGKPLEFSFTPPERVLRVAFDTKPLQEERRARSIWDKLGRAVLGGPPYTYAQFDRGWFLPDAAAESGECASFAEISVAPEDVGLTTGSFARLHTRFGASGSAELVLTESRYPLLVSLNGRFLPELSGDGPVKRLDVSDLLQAGYNELDIVVHVLPRQLGLSGLQDRTARLPRATLITDGHEVPLTEWPVCAGLAGEEAGFAAKETDTRSWHYLRFGPWREQGSNLAEIAGVGWYRVPFDLPKPGDWTLAYYAYLRLAGAGEVYLNGTRLATVSGDGEYVIPIPAVDAAGGPNVLAAALYGLDPKTGLYSLEIAADSEQMRRRRQLEIRF